MARIWCVCTPVLQAAKFESAKGKVTQSLLDLKTEMGFQSQIHTTQQAAHSFDHVLTSIPYIVQLDDVQDVNTQLQILQLYNVQTVKHPTAHFATL
jgi:hypothetical protein